MKAAADVGHRHPFLYDQHSGDHVVAAQDLRGDEVADLVEEEERSDGVRFEVVTRVATVFDGGVRR